MNLINNKAMRAKMYKSGVHKDITKIVQNFDDDTLASIESKLNSEKDTYSLNYKILLKLAKVISGNITKDGNKYINMYCEKLQVSDLSLLSDSDYLIIKIIERLDNTGVVEVDSLLTGILNSSLDSNQPEITFIGNEIINTAGKLGKGYLVEVTE